MNPLMGTYSFTVHEVQYKHNIMVGIGNILYHHSLYIIFELYLLRRVPTYVINE